LKRIQRLYAGGPNDQWIAWYIQELVELLKGDYLRKVTYGFRRNGSWVEPTLIYTAHDLRFGLSVADDDPGRVQPWANVAGAMFGSFLEYSAAWLALTPWQRVALNLPFERTTGDEPAVDGYLVDDRTYSSSGRALSRASVRSAK
jgi:hypothetical protein